MSKRQAHSFLPSNSNNVNVSSYLDLSSGLGVQFYRPAAFPELMFWWLLGCHQRQHTVMHSQMALTCDHSPRKISGGGKSVWRVDRVAGRQVCDGADKGAVSAPGAPLTPFPPALPESAFPNPVRCTPVKSLALVQVEPFEQWIITPGQGNKWTAPNCLMQHGLQWCGALAGRFHQAKW